MKMERRDPYAPPNETVWWRISKQPFARFAWLPTCLIDESDTPYPRDKWVWLRTVKFNTNFAGERYALLSENARLVKRA